MGESFMYKGHRIDTDIVERGGRFDWSYQIDSGKPVYNDESGARSQVAAEIESAVAARSAVDRMAGHQQPS